MLFILTKSFHDSVNVSILFQCFEKFFVLKTCYDVSKNLKMLITNTCNTDYEICFLITKVNTFWILHYYDTRFFNGFFCIGCSVRDCNSHTHVCRYHIFTVNHCLNIIFICEAQVT